MANRRRLFVPPDRLRAIPITVSGDEHHHLARVLRARPGDTITLFDGAGAEARARVVRVGRTETELAVEAGVGAGADAAPDDGRAARTPLVLLTAVPRGGRMDFLVQKCCELGVARIIPVTTARSVARPEPGRRARWEKIAREAARQCGRADVPVVAAPAELAAALAAPDLPERRVVLSPDAAARPLRALLPDRAPTAVLVGPEGGLAAAEAEAARAAGFVPASLGPLILRVETAAIVAVALAAEAFGALSPGNGG
ncbi:MAG TPA: 16S rRNA (uracil(1498)-N(3))-methyltransferase [Polyangia bacterium]|nr:16S rRNA (uracil(1498)-N(3))-methyltransferase [Polyangia bacterium]